MLASVTHTLGKIVNDTVVLAKVSHGLMYDAASPQSNILPYYEATMTCLYFEATIIGSQVRSGQHGQCFAISNV
eukprot:scaffold71138_cov20-Prasinocladus_malaysianus.AAC.1